MSKYKIKSFEPELYKVTEKGDTQLTENTDVFSIPIDLLPTTSDGSFNNLRLCRQSDYVLQSVEVVGVIDHDSYDFDYFNYSGLSLKIMISNLDKSFEYELGINDEHVTYDLYKEDYRGKISKQSNKKIYPETVKVIFNVTYGGLTKSCDYNLYHTKKLLNIELKSWTDEQYTDTDINYDNLKINAFFNGYDDPDELLIDDVEVDKTKWDNITGVQRINIKYTFDESSTKCSFVPQIAQLVIEKTPEVKSPIGIDILTLSFDDIQFYKDAPVYTYEAKINYNNGSNKIISDDPIVKLYILATNSIYASGQKYYIFNPIDNSFTEKTDVVIGEKIEENIYSNHWVTNDNDYFSEELVLSYSETLISAQIKNLISSKQYYRVYRKIQNLIIPNLETQYENLSINLKGKTYTVTFNNGKSVSDKLSELSYKIDKKDYYNNKWIFSETETDPTKQVDVTFTYKGAQNQSISKTVKATVHKRAPVKFEFNEKKSALSQQITNTSPSLSGLNFNVYYNNGDIEYNYNSYSNIKVIYNDEIVSLWPKLSGEDLTVYSYDKYEGCKFKLVSNNLVTEETATFLVTRKPKKIQPLKSDKSNFKFSDNKYKQFKGSRVDLTGLDYFKITYEDNSIVELDLTNKTFDDKISMLKNNGVSMYLLTWLTESEQINYFYFQLKKSESYPFVFSVIKTPEETLKFKDIITDFKVRLKTKVDDKKVFFYQGDPVSPDIEKKFTYILTILSASGTENTIEVNYNKLSDYNCTTYVKIDDVAINNWPLATELEIQNEYISKNIKFICDPIEEGSFEQLFDEVNNVQFFRVLVDFTLINGSKLCAIDEERHFGMTVSGGDYIHKIYKLTFNNGCSIISSIESSKLKINPYKWTSSSVIEVGGILYPCFNVYYTETGDIKEDFKVVFYGTNVISSAVSMKVEQNTEKIIYAGSKFADYLKGGYFTYTVVDLEGNVILEDGTNITALPEESESTETSKNVTFTYTGKVEEECDVSTRLDVKLTLVKYKINIDSDEGGTPSRSEIEYSPKTESQSFVLSINISATDEYSYSSITVTPSVAISYSISNKLLTLPPNLTGNYNIYFNLKDECLKDIGYVFDDGTVLTESNCNKFFYDDQFNLIRIKFNANNNGYCFVPNEIKTILKSSEVFYKNVNLKHLGFSSSVVRINDNAFEKCASLRDIKFDQTGSQFTIGQKAFLDCSSLSTLNFLSCGKMTNKTFLFGTPDSDSLNNNKVVKNVWNGCALRIIKITQDNFNPVVRRYYIGNGAGTYTAWLTGRCAGGFGMLFESRENSEVKKGNAVRKTHICTMNYPSSGNWQADVNNAESQGLLHKQCYVEINGIGNYVYGTYWTYEYEDRSKIIKRYKEKKKSSWVDQNYYVNGYWDLRKKCSLVVQSDINCNLWLACYGLGWSRFNYNTIVNCGYRFTTNGRVNEEFVSVESDGKGYHFGNWDMSEYVNSCIYPNVKLSNYNQTESQINAFLSKDSDAASRDDYNDAKYKFGTMLDYMIPIY